MNDKMRKLLEDARIALSFYARWMKTKEPGTEYPFGEDIEAKLRVALLKEAGK